MKVKRMYLQQVVESRQVTELPPNGRNFTQLATLEANVTRGVPTGAATGANGNTETFRNGETGGASLAVNGLRPQNNNFVLDSIDNNESLVNSITTISARALALPIASRTTVRPFFAAATGSFTSLIAGASAISLRKTRRSADRTPSVMLRAFASLFPVRCFASRLVRRAS